MKKVVKFGGSSLADAAQFKKVKKIIRADPSRRFVVPSAPGKRNSADDKITDLFYQYYDTTAEGGDGVMLRARIQTRYREIIAGLGLDLSLEGEFEHIDRNFKEGFGRDYAASRGEYLNSLIMAAYLGFPFVDAAEVVLFDGAGNFLPEETNTALRRRLRTLDRAVIPGFYGSMPDGTIRTFSRGGSDITGSLVARAVRADLYENWTDVSGFLLADPRIVDDPVPIGTITYRELHDLSCMGASVLHEDAVFPVKKEGIPINIKNTNRPQDPGTMIVSRTSLKPACGITGIAGKKGYCAVNIHKSAMDEDRSFDRKVLEVLEQRDLPFSHIPAGVDSMSIFVNQQEFRGKEDSVLSGIHRSVHPESVSLESDLALVAVGGRGSCSSPSMAGKVFTALARANIDVMAIDQSIESVTMLIGVRSRDFEPAVRAIYDQFILKSAAV